MNKPLKTMLLTIGILFFLYSYRKDNPLFSVEDILELSGENRQEWEKLIAHYSQHPEDSLKLKASLFLIQNMVYHYSLESDRLLAYYKAIGEVNKKFRWRKDINQHLIKYDSIHQIYNNVHINRTVKRDIHTLKADYLIKDIDCSFNRWKGGKWASHLSFDQFCEYLLPYRVGHEPIEAWREEMEKEYLPRINWVRDREDWRYSTFYAATFMNDQIKIGGFNVRSVLLNNLDYPPSVLNYMKAGICEDYAKLTVYIMRACGIPVAIDYVPQWPNRSKNHTWNALLSNEGKWIPFMGGERNPGQIVNPGTKKGKVFRKTFAYQENSLFHHNRPYGEALPYTLSSPFIKDVSDEYFDARDITVSLLYPPKNKTKFVYLAVFDNKEWIPVQWAFRKGKQAVFTKMEHDIAYLPVYYSSSGVEQAGNPFILTIDNQIRILKPNTNNLRTLEVKRKYPIIGGVLGYSDRMTNGRFEASHHPDFKNAVEVARIHKAPYMCFDSVMTDSVDQPYRYWRYVVANNRHCNVAELEFYSGGENINKQGTIIANRCTHPDVSAEKAFDNDGVTFFEAYAFGDGWVGLDFGKPVKIEKIRYLPRNDDNNVWRGDQYELLYQDNNQWLSLGRQTAYSETLLYKNVPENALLRLHNLTRGSEERIFTVEDGRIMWW